MNIAGYVSVIAGLFLACDECQDASMRWFLTEKCIAIVLIFAGIAITHRDGRAQDNNNF